MHVVVSLPLYRDDRHLLPETLIATPSNVSDDFFFLPDRAPMNASLPHPKVFRPGGADR